VHGQSLEEARATGFAAPPPRKAQGPIVDVHTHITEPATNHELIEAARLYRIATLVAIAPLDAGLALREQYPREVTLAVRPVLTEPRGQIALLDRAVETVHGAKAHGAPLIKLWFAPRIRDRLDFLLDSPRLDPMFKAIAATGLGTDPAGLPQTVEFVRTDDRELVMGIAQQLMARVVPAGRRR